MFLALLILILLPVFFYVNFRRSRKTIYDFSKCLPTSGDVPVLGHTHWFVGGPEKLFNNIRTLITRLDETSINKIWIGPTLYIVTMNPDDVQKILENCLEKDWSYKFLSSWLGNGLFVAPVDLWKSHRRHLLPVFHNRIVEEYVEVFAEQGDILVKRLRENVGKPEFDVFEYITACMLDIVFETAMGEKMDVQHTPETPYLRARKTVMSIINMRLFKAWLQPDILFNLTKQAKIQSESIEITHKFTDEVILKKSKMYELSGNLIEGRKDILQVLLERQLKFSNEQLREHIDSITIAGNDTTALVISYALMLLGIHKEVQNNVVKEIKSVFGDSLRAPTKDDLSKMNYLERVIKETMRLYTVVPIIGRKTDKELKLSTCTVPAGVGCAVIPFVMHRSKKLWGADADNFDPDRFLPENCAARHPCAYLPFSYGTRNCIGRHFGMLAIKSILINILRSFELSSEECNLDRLKIEILLFPVFGHLVSLKTRT